MLEMLHVTGPAGRVSLFGHSKQTMTGRMDDQIDGRMDDRTDG
jgi:hypothetical protein